MVVVGGCGKSTSKDIIPVCASAATTEFTLLDNVTLSVRLAIWKEDHPANAPIPFEAVEKNINTWQGKLRRKIKRDIIFNILVYIALMPLMVISPIIRYVSPFLLLIWIWYLWENYQIYRQKTNSEEVKSTRYYLANKKRLIEGYVRRARYIIYLTTPVALLAGFYFSGKFQAILRSPVAIILILLSTEILLFLMVEIWVRKVFAPTLQELNELLRQLESDD